MVLKPRTATKVKLLCVLGSEQGLKHVQAQFPDVEVCQCPRLIPLVSYQISQIWVAGVDATLTRQGLISPGLGDTVSSLTLLGDAYD
jgi:uracil phosphoribosyltransferase